MILSNPELKDGLVAANEALLSSSWHQFNALFETEEDCVEELYRRLHKEGDVCHYCRCRVFERHYGSRAMKCLNCNRKLWLTAGTFFNRIRCARPWLAAIWLMERGVSFSSFRFHKLLGIAYASALTIFKKITLVIHSQMGMDAISVPSSHFASLFCKRSRETPAREHPIAEQKYSEGQFVDNRRAVFGQSSGSKSMSVDGQMITGTEKYELSKREEEILEVLSDKPAHFDSLCDRTGRRAGELSSILMMLELAGFATRMPGDRYVRLKDEEINYSSTKTAGSDHFTPESHAKPVDDIIDFVGLNFHGISRKYLQNYLAAYWCYVDRPQWTLGSLLEKCLQFRVITYKEILSFVSPAMLKVVFGYAQTVS